MTFRTVVSPFGWAVSLVLSAPDAPTSSCLTISMSCPAPPAEPAAASTITTTEPSCLQIGYWVPSYHG